VTGETTPEEPDRVFGKREATPAGGLLSQINKQSQDSLRDLVLDLLENMGRDASDSDYDRDDRPVGEGPADFATREDKPGFNVIFVRAGRNKPGHVVELQEPRKFVGAPAGPSADKEIIVSDSEFSPEVREHAARQFAGKIVPARRRRLAGLTIEHGLGLDLVRTYNVMRIDGDHFENEPA
jgi:restriction system protein